MMISRPRLHVIEAVVVLTVGTLSTAHDGLAEEAGSGSALCGKGPLEILLTNDDGYEAPGIRALYAQLRLAGHHVLLAAPDRNASGTSSSFTWGKVNVIRSEDEPNVFGIAGTPATSVVLAATALYPPGRRPDLVISGINDGTNTGSLLALSGTVGAALAGTMLLDPPVPGLAVNAERPATPEARASLAPDHLTQVAAHLARVVAETRGWFCRGGRIVRPTTVLNLNYPARPVAAVRGVRVATQGRTTDLHLDFEPAGPDTFESRRIQSATSADDADSDNVLLGMGYVTVTPVSAALAVDDAPLKDLQRRLGK